MQFVGEDIPRQHYCTEYCVYFLCVGVYGVVLFFAVHCRVSSAVPLVPECLENCLVFVQGKESLTGDFGRFDFDLVHFVKIRFGNQGVYYNFDLACFGRVRLNDDCVHFDGVYLEMDGVRFDKPRFETGRVLLYDEIRLDYS